MKGRLSYLSFCWPLLTPPFGHGKVNIGSSWPFKDTCTGKCTNHCCSGLLYILFFLNPSIVVPAYCHCNRIWFNCSTSSSLVEKQQTFCFYIHIMLLRASLCARMNIQGKFYASKLNNNQVTSTYSTITPTGCINTVVLVAIHLYLQ